ncbi:MAG: LamG domain-containing protein [Verrucomicrobiae bacterium]|nr:LamG domain-containing protein [Verrucomicrobiae bacterium]
MKITKLGLLAALLTALTFTASAQSWLTNGLVAYYPFNGDADDASGNGYNASVQGTYQYLSDGTLHLIGDGALFYSGGGYVSLPNYGNLNSGFTISIWVGGETDHGNSIMAEYYVWFDDNAGRHVYIQQHDFGVGDPTAYVSFPLTIADYTPWKHMVLVYSPTNSAAYLNGIMTGSTNNVTVNPFPTVNSAIGRHWWAGGANSSVRMTMNVKNFRVYNRALSAFEVNELHTIESGPRVNLIKAVKPSFSILTLTTNYQLQVSGDLSTWTNHGTPFAATNTSMAYPQYWNVDNWGSLFFRLQSVP